MKIIEGKIYAINAIYIFMNEISNKIYQYVLEYEYQNIDDSQI